METRVGDTKIPYICKDDISQRHNPLAGGYGSLGKQCSGKQHRYEKYRVSGRPGVDLVTLAALLGHSRVQMVMRYAHPSEKHQFEAIKMIETNREAKSQRQASATA